ncbi:tetratricopeptide repeat protein [Microcoleus sp. herbarium8]|uniref:tetratricopeptide repeat protein n=1 Tax=Microcoleus sp. herbarium8 TaxID=3055436 RepID=UPI002FD128B3
MSESSANQKLDTSPEGVYRALLRCLKRTKGFGIVFVQCSPAVGFELIYRVRRDLSEKKIAILELTEPIDNLYNIVANRDDRNDLNILFIEGLEKSLEPYIKPGYGGDGNYYNLDTIPPILSHLNQRREIFRDRLSNICFVFILPTFAIKYIIRRAPDFFDWGSGVFQFSTSIYSSIEFNNYVCYYACPPPPPPPPPSPPKPKPKPVGSNNKGVSRFCKYIRRLSSIFTGFITYYIRLIFRIYIRSIFDREIDQCAVNKEVDASILELIRLQQKQSYLKQTQSLKQTVSSFDEKDEASSFFDVDESEFRIKQGNSLLRVNRYEEAIKKYEQAIRLKPDSSEAWNFRGIALLQLGRYEKSIASFDKALEIKPDYQDAKTNRETAFKELN